MNVITFEEFRLNKEKYFSKIEKGELFIHPTDTIYGIGCDATNSDAIKKLRDVKKRPKSPFSIIAPSKEWIIENCEVTPEAMQWVEKLPGPYTLILKLKNNNAVSSETNNGKDTIGVRMPNHWFGYVAKELKRPFITTSANISGKEYMKNIDELDIDIKKHMSFIIYEGDKEGMPSKLVNLTMEEISIGRV